MRGSCGSAPTFSSRVQRVRGGSLTRLRVKSPAGGSSGANLDAPRNESTDLAHRKSCSGTLRGGPRCRKTWSARRIHTVGNRHVRNNTKCVVLLHGAATNAAEQSLLHPTPEAHDSHLGRRLWRDNALALAVTEFVERLFTSSMSTGTSRVQIQGSTIQVVMPMTYQKSC